jgi:hypothetical protein
MFAILKRQFRDRPEVYAFFKRNRLLCCFITIMSAINMQCLNLLQSNLFHRSAFRCPWNEDLRYQVRLGGTVAILVATLPQMIIQSSFVSAQKGFDNQSLLSISTSTLAISYGLAMRALHWLARKAQKKGKVLPTQIGSSNGAPTQLYHTGAGSTAAIPDIGESTMTAGIELILATSNHTPQSSHGLEEDNTSGAHVAAKRRSTEVTDAHATTPTVAFAPSRGGPQQRALLTDTSSSPNLITRKVSFSPTPVGAAEMSQLHTGAHANTKSSTATATATRVGGSALRLQLANGPLTPTPVVGGASGSGSGIPNHSTMAMHDNLPGQLALVSAR